MTDLTRAKLPRRLALLLPLAAAGCSYIEDTFTDTPKPKLPGIRVALADSNRGFAVDNPRGLKVSLPRPSPRAAWPQPGGSVTHEAGHAAVADKLAEAWHADIGGSAGYRQKIPSQPVIADGRVFTMDPDGLVSAFDVTSGNRIWQFDTTPEDDRSSNIGGGVAVEGATLYVATGRAEALALDAATGAVRWRAPTAQPARSAPTVADGKLFVPLLGNAILALAAKDGKRVWLYQGTESTTAMLGLPASAYADGLLVAGFGSGELVALRASTGAVVWIDSLASARGQGTSTDLSAIHGLPVIQDGRVYAVSLGGLMLSLDLRSGRRLWEREVASADTPCMAGEWLFVLSTDAQLAAIQREDGSVAWITQMQKFEDMEKLKDAIFWTGPILVGDRLIVVSGTGIAQAVSPYTGEIIGEQELSAPASMAPVVAQGTVFVVTDDAKLLALR
jgi:outer membrane protein assembly factor BamB